ncbi:MAG: hypothetical protein WA948_03700 [Pontixanthobacter sp.]
MVAYLIGMIAFIPAAAMVTENDRLKVGGTIWDGAAVVGSTILFDWDFAPISTIGNFAFAADWHLTSAGPGSDMTGRMVQAGEQLRFEEIAGVGDGNLLDVLFPNLPLTCRLSADVALDYVRIGGEEQGGSGSLTTGPASCNAKDLAAFPVDLPAMEGNMTPAPGTTTGALMSAQDRRHLVELRWSEEGALSIWPTQAATTLAPVLAGQRYDTQVD